MRMLRGDTRLYMFTILDALGTISTSIVLGTRSENDLSLTTLWLFVPSILRRMELLETSI
jgi:hypothetical protein